MTSRTFRLLESAALCFMIISSAAAEEQVQIADPYEILERVDHATKAVTSVSYSTTVTPSGVARNFASDATGSGLMSGWNGTGPELFYAKISTTQPGTEVEVMIEGGGNGETFFLVDHGSKKAYEDMDPLVMGAHAYTLANLGMIEFIHPSPFDDELMADTLRLEEDEQVGQVVCYRIEVEYGDGLGRSTWFFGKSDNLPRRRIRYFDIPGQGNGSIDIVIDSLEVNPDIDPKHFRLNLPEGYEQIDDFAP